MHSLELSVHAIIHWSCFGYKSVRRIKEKFLMIYLSLSECWIGQDLYDIIFSPFFSELERCFSSLKLGAKLFYMKINTGVEY